VGRSAYISRRDGRYPFRARRPACLARISGSAFRISLRTGDYKVPAVRAARIFILVAERLVGHSDMLRRITGLDETSKRLLARADVAKHEGVGSVS
jgi:hypothetical protein